MKIFLKTCLLIFCMGLAACGTDSGDDRTSVGTSTGNPPVPKKVVPHFATFIPESALGADGHDTDEAVMQTNTIATSPQYLTGPAALWEDLFLFGGIKVARDLREGIETAGLDIKNQLNILGIAEITDEIQTIDLTTALIFGDPKDWAAELVTAPDDFVRIYFIQRANEDFSEDLIQGTYLLHTDADGRADQGIFAFVDPELIGPVVAAGTVLIEMAFDFTDPEQNLLLMRMELFNLTSGDYYDFHLHYQCNTLTQKCSGEYLDIATLAPTREFGDGDVVFDWDENTRAVCLANITYDEDISLGNTQSFIGPDIPGDDDVVSGVCTLNDTVWDDHLYTPDDLPIRFGDSDGASGTAVALFDNGLTKAGWDQYITSDLIASWLAASQFEP